MNVNERECEKQRGEDEKGRDIFRGLQKVRQKKKKKKKKKPAKFSGSFRGGRVIVKVKQGCKADGRDGRGRG